MKLKKIASLALAGIMAVSMLTACDTTSNDNDDNQDDDIVIPVDDSFATQVNALLNAATKNTLAISSDASLTAALNNIVDHLSSHELATAVDNGDGEIGFVTNNTDTKDMRHLMDLDDDASLTATTGKNEENATGNWQPNKKDYWKYFSNSANSVNTTLDLIVVDGSNTDEGLAEVVADTLKGLIVEQRMPNNGANGGKKYDYDYTGNIASVKIDNLRGDDSYYVVALEVTQTPTEVTNG